VGCGTDGPGGEAEAATNEDLHDLNVGGLDKKASARIERHGEAGEAK